MVVCFLVVCAIWFTPLLGFPLWENLSICYSPLLVLTVIASVTNTDTLSYCALCCMFTLRHREGLRIVNVMCFSRWLCKARFRLDHQVLKISILVWFTAQYQSDLKMFIEARPWQRWDWLECFVACAPLVFYIHTRPWGHCGLGGNQWSNRRIFCLWWSQFNHHCIFPARLSPDTSA